MALGVPSSASVRMGSACRLTAAIAIGAVPTSTMAKAATTAAERSAKDQARPVPPRRSADRPAAAAGRPAARTGGPVLRSPPGPGPWPGTRRRTTAPSAAWSSGRCRRPRGSPGPRRGPSRPGTARRGRPVRRGRVARRPLSSSAPMTARATHDEEVDRPAVGRVERAECAHPRREEAGLGRLRHGLDHAGQGAAAALPEAPARPGLEHRHADQEEAAHGEDRATETPMRRRVGQRDRHARGAIEEDGTGCAEEPGQPGRRSPRRPRRTPRRGGPSPRWPPRRAATTGPAGATSNQTPSPIWIQTVAAAAWTGWFDQMVTPLLTTCCTHGGDVLAAGWITPDGSPSGMEDCSCSSPSRTHRQSEPDPQDVPGQRLGTRGRREGNAVCPCPRAAGTAPSGRR